MAPRLWNNLPPEIRAAPTLCTFKIQLKTWLYVQAFPPASTKSNLNFIFSSLSIIYNFWYVLLTTNVLILYYNYIYLLLAAQSGINIPDGQDINQINK